MNKFRKLCFLTLWIVLNTQNISCQIYGDSNANAANTYVRATTTRNFYSSVNRFQTQIIRPVGTTGYFTATRNAMATSVESISNGEAGFNVTSANLTDTNITTNSTIINLENPEYEKPINWTSGFGTHYGPFPSNPHFSEVGYQPNDVGVGCSDGRPGGDPQWNNILSKGVYPSPNIVNHEKTVWPVAYTVAVSAAVWNKEDVCWKTLKIRNRDKPELVIEAYIVDFCPIGYCNWQEKNLARNVDIYGEKAWLALGADVNESKLDIEIEWPEGVIPHDAIKLPNAGFTRINKTLITVTAPLLIAFFYRYVF